jgi:hypothetical protein
MLKSLIDSRIKAFERRYGYDMSYARMLLRTRLQAFMRFAQVTKMSTYQDGVPRDPWYAAKIAATLFEDCGPCTQLVIRMAEEAKVPPQMLRAVLARDFAALEPGTALGLRYAEAVLAHSPAMESLRQQIIMQWGERGLVSLAFAITTGRLFPTLKYALGYGHSCARLDVDGEVTPFVRPASLSPIS